MSSSLLLPIHGKSFTFDVALAGFAASSAFFSASAVAEDKAATLSSTADVDDQAPSSEDMKEAQKGAPVLRFANMLYMHIFCF